MIFDTCQQNQNQTCDVVQKVIVKLLLGKVKDNDDGTYQRATWTICNIV